MEPMLDSPAMVQNFRKVLLVVTGGIAAYKSLDLIRLLQERGIEITTVLTRAGAEMVTPLALASLTGNKVYQELFSLTDESEMGHIRLARDADVVIVAPASADFIARMASGLADNLATTLLLVTETPVLIAPAMNTSMWNHPATIRNLERLRADGVHTVGPGTGMLACGEKGPGRMAEPAEITEALGQLFASQGTLEDIRALVTSGPTIEPIDPVRFLGNRSSGKQGHAIASALAARGANVTLVAGPSSEPIPAVARTVQVETSAEMLAACEEALPVDVAVFAAAVSDWRPTQVRSQKIKRGEGVPTRLDLAESPDILAHIADARNNRPRLVVGFAAETEKVIENARAKRTAKKCDWIVANDVSTESGAFGGDSNAVHLITDEGDETWPRASKADVAGRLADRIAEKLERDLAA